MKLPPIHKKWLTLPILGLVIWSVAALAAPTVSSVNPTSATAGVPVVLRATFTDDGSPVTSCELYIESELVGSMNLSGNQASRSHTFVEEGVYLAFVFCKQANDDFASGPNTSIDVGAGAPPPPAPVCGNTQCEGGETSLSCPADCPAPPPPPEVCGNGQCLAGETNASCPADCPPPGPVCGDDVCQPPENSAFCPNDCPAPPPGPVCGNGQCQAGESNANCPADCPAPPPPGPVCGNGQCQAGETNASCPADCPAPPPPAEVCGNGQCLASETNANCPADCPGPVPPPAEVCGNGQCLASETNANCPADCPGPIPPPPAEVCGNGQCLANETNDNCPADCPGVNPPPGEICGNGQCLASETNANCPADCPATPVEPQPEPEPTPEQPQSAPAAVVQFVSGVVTNVIIQPVTQAVTAVRTYVQDVQTDPEIQQVNQTVTTPAAVVLAAASTGVTVGTVGFQVFGLMLVSQSSLLFRRKKGVSYGTVRNRSTGMPIDLAIIRLADQTTGRTIKTRVTDREGRYILVAPAGTFKSEVRATNHVPTEVPVKLPEGGTVTEQITMEPLGGVPNENALKKAARIKLARNALAFSGPVLAFLALVITPKPLQVSMFFLNLALFLIFLRLSRAPHPKRSGTVRGPDGKPLSGAIVRIMEAQYGRVLDSQLTDRSGRYAFLVGPNTYFLRFEKAGLQTAQTEPIDLTQAKDATIVAQDAQLAA